jgi:hypothetical protein
MKRNPTARTVAETVPTQAMKYLSEMLDAAPETIPEILKSRLLDFLAEPGRRLTVIIY